MSCELGRPANAAERAAGNQAIDAALNFAAHAVAMATIQTRKMNWIKNPTAWEQAQLWKQKRAAAREQFEAANTAAISAFSTAQANLVTGMGDISARRATQRIQAAHDAQLAELQNSFNMEV